MSNNPLRKVAEFGQSIWLDFLRRHLVTSGELAKLIQEDGLRGVTSNPSIFQKAIGGSNDYDEAIRSLTREGRSVDEIYQALTVGDVQSAADRFRPVYQDTDGHDGFVSLEVSPHLAHETDETINEARRLWSALSRPNVFIKVPATQEGLPAIEQLISEGINVNVTLLFGLDRYRAVADAYLSGLEKRVANGQPIDRVASVASFFLSRIDVLVDPLLEQRMKGNGRAADAAGQAHGQVAIASARIAYQIYHEIYDSERFRKLAQHGARTQRLLWASTSTKNPEYSDVKYVEALIGPETVNTVPMETLNAYRDHGDPAPRLTDDVEGSRRVLESLSGMEIDLEAVTQQLEDEGIEKFNKPFDRLMDTLQTRREECLKERSDPQRMCVGDHEGAVKKRVEVLEKARFCARLWRKDPSLWKSDPENQRQIRDGLGWLRVMEKMEEQIGALADFAAESREAGFSRVIHMGMGGSSLAPLVFERVFGMQGDGLALAVLDTTDPGTILDLQDLAPLEETLFIVASKSGTTAELSAFADYFYAKVREAKGDRAGENFVAITDPGTPLAKHAEERGFRQCFLNMPDIGGRYSALTYFGLVPAALLGIDVAEVLDRASLMAHACASCVPADQNPGLQLGAAIGELARQGRDKLTFIMPDELASFGLWLEQLLAESTGKEGRGIVPIAGEALGNPDVYDNDRVFVQFRLKDRGTQTMDQGVEALRHAGHPVIVIDLNDKMDVAQEFFRWEVATAVAGSVLEINAFNQPNVQESKDNTNDLLKEVEDKGELPKDTPAMTKEPLELYADEAAGDVAESLREFFVQKVFGDYVAIMAYFTETSATETLLQTIRHRLRDRLRVATTLGYGPRFLHSTGQLHKGGPNTGIFLQLTADDPNDAEIPDRPYTFGTFKRAQAMGDLRALRRHGRRVVRVHLGADVGEGLAKLDDLMLSWTGLPVHASTA